MNAPSPGDSTREQRVTVPDEDVRIGMEAMYSNKTAKSPGHAFLEAVYPVWRQRELALRELVAEQQLDEARKLHQPNRETDHLPYEGTAWCAHCGYSWPCATARALGMT